MGTSSCGRNSGICCRCLWNVDFLPNKDRIIHERSRKKCKVCTSDRSGHQSNPNSSGYHFHCFSGSRDYHLSTKFRIYSIVFSTVLHGFSGNSCCFNRRGFCQQSYGLACIDWNFFISRNFDNDADSRKCRNSNGYVGNDSDYRVQRYDFICINKKGRGKPCKISGKINSSTIVFQF